MYAVNKTILKGHFPTNIQLSWKKNSIEQNKSRKLEIKYWITVVEVDYSSNQIKYLFMKFDLLTGSQEIKLAIVKF